MKNSAYYSMTLKAPSKSMSYPGIWELKWTSLEVLFPNHLGKKEVAKKELSTPLSIPRPETICIQMPQNLRNKKFHSFLFLIWLTTFIGMRIYPSILVWLLCCLCAHHWNRSYSGERGNHHVASTSPKPKNGVLKRKGIFPKKVCFIF